MSSDNVINLQVNDETASMIVQGNAALINKEDFKKASEYIKSCMSPEEWEGLRNLHNFDLMPITCHTTDITAAVQEGE